MNWPELQELTQELPSEAKIYPGWQRLQVVEEDHCNQLLIHAVHVVPPFKYPSLQVVQVVAEEDMQSLQFDTAQVLATHDPEERT